MVLRSIIFVMGTSAILAAIFIVAGIGYFKIFRKYYIWDKCILCEKRFMGKTGDFMCPGCRKKNEKERSRRKGRDIERI